MTPENCPNCNNPLYDSFLQTDFEANPDDEKLEISQNYFNQNLDDLLKEYPGEWVAIIEEEVVFHHKELEALTDHVYNKYEDRPIFMEKVEPLQEISLPSLSE